MTNVDRSRNMDLFYEDARRLINEGNQLFAKEIMIFYKELSFSFYNLPTYFL